MASLECSDNGRQERLREVNRLRPHWNGIAYTENVDLKNLRVTLFCDLNGDYNDVSQSDNPTIAMDVTRCVHVRDRNDKPQKVIQAWYHSSRRVVEVTLKDELTPGKYYLRLSNDCLDLHLDPRFDSCDFEYFDNQVQLDIDPLARPKCDNQIQEPEISYTARDFPGFLRLISDRLALTMPQWRETHVPDIGVAITEIMAYVADHLAQFQDAVATEAYLSTARSRISARRHAKLVGYNIDEGQNSHAFLHFNVIVDVRINPRDVYFITLPGDESAFSETNLMESALRDLPSGAFESFEFATNDFQRSIESDELSPSEIVDPLRLVIEIQFCSISKFNPWHQLIHHLRRFLAPWLEALFPRSEGLLAAWTIAKSLFQLSQTQIAFLVDRLNELSRNTDFTALFDVAKLSEWGQSQIAFCHPQHDRSRINQILLFELFPDCFDRSRIDNRVELIEAHNVIELYTWDQQNCCLPVGSTHATLRDRWLNDNQDKRCQPAFNHSAQVRPRKTALRLKPGDYLLFEELVDPESGQTIDANLRHRQVVRLTRVKAKQDPVNRIPVLEVWWSEEDKLQFSLCISSTMRRAPCRFLSNVSVARGNIFPIDHGQSINDEELQPVRSEDSELTCRNQQVTHPAPPRIEPYRPKLEKPRISYRRSSMGESTDASANSWLTNREFKGIPRLPLITLTGIPAHPNSGKPIFAIDLLRKSMTCGDCLACLDSEASRALQNVVSPQLGQEFIRFQADAQGGMSEALRKRGAGICRRIAQQLRWFPQLDLLSSKSTEKHFVLEVDDYGYGKLRFGTTLGLQPEAGTQFYANYRVGGGTNGNVGADSIVRVVFRNGLHSIIRSIRNPLAAQGGVAAESLASIKLNAGQAAHELKRAITADDYVSILRDKMQAQVQNALCRITPLPDKTSLVEIIVDPRQVSTKNLEQRIEQVLDDYRRVGHRVRVKLAVYAGIILELTVSCRKGFSSSQIYDDLADRFSERELADGRKAFFHPDRFTFGDKIFKSKIIAEAKEVPGVIDVRVDALELKGFPDPCPEPDVLCLPHDRLPVLRNDPGEPHSGLLTINLSFADASL